MGLRARPLKCPFKGSIQSSTLNPTDRECKVQGQCCLDQAWDVFVLPGRHHRGPRTQEGPDLGQTPSSSKLSIGLIGFKVLGVEFRLGLRV